jgi:hypothetical protein
VTDTPKRKRPTAEEMDERLVVPLDPEKLVEGILHAAPNSENDEAGAERERARDRAGTEG